MGVETKSNDTMPVDRTGERIREKFAKLVYEGGQHLSNMAFERVGIDPNTLNPGVRYRVTLTSADHRTRVVASRDAQLLSTQDSTRLIEVREVNQGEKIFLRGRYVEPDGKMWQIADSSQGQPWYEADLPTEDLVGMVERMERFDEFSSEIEVSFSAYRPSDYMRS
jgi:hypothetical protein